MRRRLVFISIQGHVGTNGNLVEDSVAKGVLDANISDELIPFSGVHGREFRMNKYIII